MIQNPCAYHQIEESIPKAGLMIQIGKEQETRQELQINMHFATFHIDL